MRALKRRLANHLALIRMSRQDLRVRFADRIRIVRHSEQLDPPEHRSRCRERLLLPFVDQVIEGLDRTRALPAIDQHLRHLQLGARHYARQRRISLAQQL